MSATDYADAVRELLAGLRQRYGEPAGPAVAAVPAHGDAVVDQLVRSVLQWESAASDAAAAYGAILGSFADYNELRACFADELAGVIGETAPMAQERALRLRAVLNAVFDREHGLSLEHLREMPKREAKAYVASLDGIPPFAAARILLLELGGHAVPVDGRLLGLIESAGAVEPGLDPAAAASKLERVIRSEEAREAYELLEAWSAAGGSGVKRGGRSARSGRSRGAAGGRRKAADDKPAKAATGTR